MRITTAALQTVLQNAAADIGIGDSLEGRLSYAATEERGVWEVSFAIRTGNLDGQGGLILLEPSPEHPPLGADDGPHAS